MVLSRGNCLRLADSSVRLADTVSMLAVMCFTSAVMGGMVRIRALSCTVAVSRLAVIASSRRALARTAGSLTTVLSDVSSESILGNMADTDGIRS